MESYREKLKQESWILGLSCVVLLVFGALGILGEAGLIEFGPGAGDSHWQSQWRGGITGSCFALFILLAVGLILDLSALRSQEKLKKHYVKSHDERTIQVRTAAQAAGCRIFLILGLVAAVVAGYFHMVVSLTILACVFALAIVCAGLKLYYFKKF